MQISVFVMMKRFLPAAFIFLVFIITLKFPYKIVKKNLVNWRERKDKMKKYCESEEKAIILKRNRFGSEKIFQKKLMENIVQVARLQVNWCLGKYLKRKHFLVRKQNQTNFPISS